MNPLPIKTFEELHRALKTTSQIALFPAKARKAALRLYKQRATLDEILRALDLNPGDWKTTLRKTVEKELWGDPKSSEPPSKHFYIYDVETKQLAGKFPSRAAAEEHIRTDIADTWSRACACLQQPDPEKPFSGEYLILEQVARVQPHVTPVISFEEVPES